MFEDDLKGWPKRELHNDEVIRAVIAQPLRAHELFDCAVGDDEYVRMRAADALEKVCRHDRRIVQPLTPRLLAEMSEVDQPSVQWHLAQILGELALDGDERRQAVRVVRRLLDASDDALVLSHALTALAAFATADPALHEIAVAHVEAFVADQRPSVSTRARRLRAALIASGCRSASRRRTCTGGGPPAAGDSLVQGAG